MGIRGLTTFVAQNHDQSFIPYRLHNCSLVIDGNSVASQLYVKEYGRSKANHCAFGGDYNEYARVVKRFFTLLSCCEVKSIVIFDGGKEPRKFSTSLARLKGNILMTGKIRPGSCFDCPLPLLMREVFKWVAAHSGAVIGVCDFEADEEIAALARALSCPLLSFDSDFYIHAVPAYIPFPTLATELTEEVLNPGDESSSGSILRFLECSAFSVDKFLSRIHGGDWRKKSHGTQRILQVEVLPLIAALLGNDYVKPKTFHHFLSQLPIPKSKCTNHRQRLIVGLLEWLRLEESLESAINKILNHTKKGQRMQLEKIIRETVNVYVGCSSKLLHQLNLCFCLSPEVHSPGKEEEGTETDLTHMLAANEVCEKIKKAELENSRNSSEIKCLESVEHESFIQSDFNDFKNDDQSFSEDDDGSDTEVALDSFCTVDQQDAAWDEKRSQLPTWFIKRFRKFELPPIFMDIFMQRSYIYPTQVEDQSRPHSHAISLPILSAIVRLLTPEDDTSIDCWTRVNRHAASVRLDPWPKNPSWPAPEDLFVTPECRRINIMLQVLNLIDNLEEKNDARKVSLESLPSDWRLLALSLAYWRRNSSLHKVDEHFLIAACFCIVVLRVVDMRAGPPGRKSRKARKEKKKLHFLKASEDSEDKLQEGFDNEDAVLSKLDKSICNTGAMTTLTSEKATEEVQVEMDDSRKNVKELLQTVNILDCLRVCSSDGKLNELRQVDEDMGRAALLGGKRHRPFNLTTVHCFSELQSVILHVGYLNSLLGEPFVSNAPHTSFSGTIAYNSHFEIRGKSYSHLSKKSLWEILLGTSAPSLENLMDAFFKCILTLTWGEIPIEFSCKKKNRRKKRCKMAAEETCKLVVETSEEESEKPIYDPENKYSLLNFIDADC